MFKDEVLTSQQWLRYFAKPAKYWSPAINYAKRVSVWAGEPIRSDAFIEAAKKLNYETRMMKGEIHIRAELQ